VTCQALDARLRIRDDAAVSRLAAGQNPLVSAASRLLSNIGRLKSQETPKTIEALRTRLDKRIQQFTRQALQAGVEDDKVKVASYLLCTVADEAVLARKWGDESDWATNSLLNAFHGETSGGEMFFQLLERYMRKTAGNVEMLELMYVCLALGFQGRYGTSEQDGKELQRLRHDVFECIQRQRGAVASRISCIELPHRHEPRRQVVLIPGWLPVVATLLSLGVLYLGLTWKLDQRRDTALVPFQQFGALPSVHGLERGLPR
jgi:type VI secretion system protein ImpK